MALTDEDKQWISEHFERIRTEFSLRLDRVETEFPQRVERVETRLLTQFHDERQSASEQLERVETKLLTAFHKWASPFEARQRSHSAALRAFDVLLEDLTDRVKKLEEGKQ